MISFAKLSGMCLMSVSAFMGICLLKLALNQSIPEGANTETLLRAMPYLALNGKFWLALCCYAAALVVFLFLLQDGQVNKVFTMTIGINILLTNLGAFLLFGDALEKPHILGMLLIITGVFLINEY